MTRLKTPGDPGAKSPLAGCAIFIAAGVMMIFLIGFSVLTLFRQYAEIEKFTDPRAQPVMVTPLENKEAELNALAERVEKFRQQLDGNTGATLALSADDLNLAIATYDAFKELRGTFHVNEITADALRVAISFQLNGKPRLARGDESGWVASDPRFLNAVMVAKPALLKREVVLRIEALEVSKAKPPQEFLDQMSPYRITERYLTDSIIGPAMAKLTRVEIADGALVLKSVPGETAADTITNAEVDSASSRLFKALAIGASIFLIFVALIILMGFRAKRRAS